MKTAFGVVIATPLVLIQALFAEPPRSATPKEIISALEVIAAKTVSSTDAARLRRRAIQELQDLVKNYPNTAEAKEAALLKDLNKSKP
jgi:hypothetical protein